MPNLPQSGVQLVAQGDAAFFATLNKGRSALGDFGDAARKAGGGFGALQEIATGALRHIGALAVEVGVQAARAVGAFVGDSIRAAGEFETNLNVLQATSGATTEELERVRQTAIDLGADLTLPATSAQDAQLSMLELIKAGFSVDEAMAAAKGSLQLAAAAEVDAATGAEMMAAAINAFKLEASDAVHIADIFANAVNVSAASMTDINQGFQQAGFAFHQAGFGADDLATSLAILTNAGLSGSDAGTALKNAIMRMFNPTEKAKGVMDELGLSFYNADGVMKPFPQILGEIAAATAHLTPQERDAALSTIFLSDGMKALMPLLSAGQDEFLKTRDAINAEGAAADLAAARTKGFEGAMAGLESQIETAQLVLGEKLLPILTPLVQQMAEGVGAVTEFASGFLNLAPAITSSSDPLTTFFNVLRTLAPEFSPVITQAQQVADVFMGALNEGIRQGAAAFEFVRGIVQSVMPAVQMTVQTVLGAILTFWQNNGASIMAFVGETWERVQSIIQVALELAAGIVQGVLAIITGFIQDHGDEIQQVLTNAWNIISNLIKGTLAFIEGILKAALAIFKGDWQGAWKAIQEMAVTVTLALKEIVLSFLDTIAVYFGTSVSEIVATWASNFRKMKETAGRILDSVISLITGLVGDFAEAASSVGSAIIDGIKNGISNGISGLMDAARSAARRAIDAAKAALKISSPSQEFFDIGTAVGEGMELGIRYSTGGVLAAAAELGQQASAAALEAAQGVSVPAMTGAATALPPAPGGFTGEDYANLSPGEQLAAIFGTLAALAPAAPATGGGGGGSTTTIDNSRHVTYAPRYGEGITPNQTLDAALAQALAR